MTYTTRLFTASYDYIYIVLFVDFILFIISVSYMHMFFQTSNDTALHMASGILPRIRVPSSTNDLNTELAYDSDDDDDGEEDDIFLFLA
jgi:hypothetical protein